MNKRYTIFVLSDSHPCTINTPTMGRTNYDKFVVYGMEALQREVKALQDSGKIVTEVVTDLGTRIYF